MDTGQGSVSSFRSRIAAYPAEARRVLASKALRGFADGFVSLLLPLYLLELGFGALEVGVLSTVTLLGSGLLTLAVGFLARRFGERRLLLGACALMAATGIGFATTSAFWPLLLIAAVGTLNPSSGDVSVFLPLEHAVLSRAAGDERRTAVFAVYSLAGALAGALGALAAAAPSWLSTFGVSSLASMQAMFLLYAAIAVLAGLLYRGLPDTAGAAQVPRAALGPSRRRVYLLAGLFSIDAVGGGLVVQSLLALWLHQRFDLSIAATGVLFFWTSLLSAFSYLAAVRIAGRFGLLHTMVFTHMPANACLALIPFMPALEPVIVLLLVRSALSQMDVPTRSSYVMAVVSPAERPAAASLTAVPRSLAAAASPALAGWLMALSPFGWPLLLAGTLKIAYDLLLLAAFRRIRPPEETGARPPPRP